MQDPLEEWRQESFQHLFGGLFNPHAAPEATLFNDGFNNLARYGFVLDSDTPAHGFPVIGTNLESSTAAPAGAHSHSFGGLTLFGQGGVTLTETESSARFSYRRLRADGVGHVSDYRVGSIRYIAEISTNLSEWTNGPEYLEQVGTPVDNGDGSETVTLRPVHADTEPVFFRVRLQRD